MREKGESLRAPNLVLMPALDEEDGIGLTIAELKEYLDDPQILVVDGNSRDNTVHVAKRMGADVVFQTGTGKGDAIDCALRYMTSDLCYVVLTDADYTYPAEYIPRMIEILNENPQVGMVCGNRFNSHLDRVAMRDLNYLGNRFLAFAQSVLNGIALRDPLTGLRVIRWEILKDWKPKSNGFDIEVELNRHVERQGYSIAEIEIPYRPRVGEKKLKLKHGFSILKRIVSESIF